MLCILARLDYVISMEYENVCLMPAASFFYFYFLFIYLFILQLALLTPRRKPGTMGKGGHPLTSLHKDVLTLTMQKEVHLGTDGGTPSSTA